MSKVSIILPVYNGEKYLGESLNSILKQTYTDWELIIVNDCSTDTSVDIIYDYMKRDQRIKLISNEVNKKLPASLNIGFSSATGEYLTWTSDDNIYLESAIEKMVNYLDNHNDMLVCAGMKSIDDVGNIFAEWGAYSDDFMFYQDGVGACFMYKRKVLDDLGGYDTNMFLVEDYEYWLRILTNYGSIGYIDEKLYLYRFHGGSLTGTRKQDIRRQLLRLRRKYINSILNHYNKDFFYLTRIYMDFLFDKSGEFEDLLPLFQKKYIGLKKLVVLGEENKIIAYGAGKVGDKAYEILGNRIDLYADRSGEKYNYNKNGIEIIKPEEIPQYIAGRNLLISMTDEKVYEILEDEKFSDIEKIYVLDWEI